MDSLNEGCNKDTERHATIPLFSQEWRYETSQRSDGCVTVRTFLDGEWVWIDILKPTGKTRQDIKANIYDQVLNICGVHDVALKTADAYQISSHVK